ncbi:putative pentatricopeptide repeat-containing protein At1g12700, mitochondrial [Hevea brasiliensis]|uniref:putative pentatricopeptide repeat-containing protein At1g12700, mitochondrial n=1 Tax=Hevea brasiliensis TaxID=3981 RepID=UPI0025DC6F1C|nr:putative pentatricopeptide repeat-containing protein At1g12700, mitochondrial [Hevea brasiliensis]
MCRAGRLTDAKELFSRLFEQGLKPDVYTYSIIIKGLCNEGLLDEAYKVFRGMEECGCLMDGCRYNVIIQGFLCIKIYQATLLIDEMVDKGFSADATTFELMDEEISAISACGGFYLASIVACEHIVLLHYRDIMSLDLAVLLQVQVLVLPFKNKELPLILHLMMEALMENLKALLVDGFLLGLGLWEARRPGIALEVFKNMCSHGQQPDKVTFSIILDGLCKQGYLDEALTLFKAMDCVSFTILIDGMCKAGRLNDAKELFFRHFEKGLQPNVYTYSTIIKGLCKEGLLDEAYKVFRGMEKSGCVPNGCCYNVIIQGFLRHEDVAKATQLIDEMVDKGFSADATTFECFSPFFHTGNQCMLWFLSCKHFDLALVLQVQVLVLPYKNKELPLILHMIMVQIGNSVSL